MKTALLILVIIGLVVYGIDKALKDAPTVPSGDDPNYFPFYDDEEQP